MKETKNIHIYIYTHRLHYGIGGSFFALKGLVSSGNGWADDSYHGSSSPW